MILMDRKAFINTIVEVLKYDKKYRAIEVRDQLMRLLGRAEVNFVPQYAFANHGRSYQRWEVVELRVPVPLLEMAEENEKILEELVEYVYEESDEYALYHVEIRPQVIDIPQKTYEHDVVFDEIEDKVIQGIRDAKFIIWVAVAWFSNEIIYVFLTIFLYLLKCPQSLILSALRAFCFCGKPHISRSIFLYFRYQSWLKSW